MNRTILYSVLSCTNTCISLMFTTHGMLFPAALMMGSATCFFAAACFSLKNA